MSSSPVLLLQAASAVVALAAPRTLRKVRRLGFACCSVTGVALSLMRDS
jgi:hypothetical protein